MGGPSARNNHAIWINPREPIIYIFGGLYGSDYYNDLWTFDVTSRTWTLLTMSSDQIIMPRAPAAFWYAGDFSSLFIFGGKNRQGLGFIIPFL